MRTCFPAGVDDKLAPRVDDKLAPRVDDKLATRVDDKLAPPFTCCLIVLLYTLLIIVEEILNHCKSLQVKIHHLEEETDAL